MRGAASTTPSTPAINKLSVERYRGIPSRQWRPARGINVILGGGLGFSELTIAALLRRVKTCPTLTPGRAGIILLISGIM
jgi:hypothetical protein